MLLVEQKSAGRDLTAAHEQAGTYFDALPERDRPRYQLLCDFQTFELLDRDEREEARFALADLPQHVEKFGFIIGVQRRTFRDRDPVNIEASELIARLHDALKASGYEGTTWSTSSCGSSSACSPTTPESSSRATSSFSSSRNARPPMSRISVPGWLGCSKC